MVSKQTPKNPQKYFLSVLEYFRILEIKKLGNKTLGRAQVGCAHQGHLPYSIFYSILVPQDKINLYILP